MSTECEHSGHPPSHASVLLPATKYGHACGGMVIARLQGHARARACVFVYVCVCAYACMHVRLHVCVCVCVKGQRLTVSLSPVNTKAPSLTRFHSCMTCRCFQSVPRIFRN